MSHDDPFRLLDLPPDCDDDGRIRAAYHALVRAGGADARVNAAYAAIRHPADRRRRRWREAHSLIGVPPDDEHQGPPDLTALIHELAALSDWELGEDA